MASDVVHGLHATRARRVEETKSADRSKTSAPAGQPALWLMTLMCTYLMELLLQLGIPALSLGGEPKSSLRAHLSHHMTSLFVVLLCVGNENRGSHTPAQLLQLLTFGCGALSTWLHAPAPT